MAVIRTRRLFVWGVSATGLKLGDPAADEPGVTVDASLYTCPPETRAVLRTWTVVLGGTPASWEPRPYAHLKLLPAGVGQPFAVWFNWFWDPNLPGEPASYGHTWNAQVALDPGDQLTLYNGTRTYLHCHATGAEIPFPQT